MPKEVGQNDAFEEGKKKKGAVKGFFKILFLPLIAPFILAIQIVKSFFHNLKLCIKTGKQCLKDYKQGQGALQLRLEEEKAKRHIPFSELLKLWNIKSELEIYQKQRELTARIIVWALAYVFSVLIILGASSHVLYLITGIGTFFVATLGILQSLWKKDVLKSKSFIYFSDWLKFWA
jgi:hypothetical protein